MPGHFQASCDGDENASLTHALPQMLLGGEHRIHRSGGVAMHGWKNVTVGVERKSDPGMSQHLGHQFDVHTPRQQDRSAVSRRSWKRIIGSPFAAVAR